MSVRKTAEQQELKIRSDRITLLLVDDHSIVRAGFRRLLEDSSDMEVVEEAASGEQAVTEYARLLPDVVIMDLTMPGIGGLEAIRRIRSKHPDARILVLSVHEDVVYSSRVLQAGALGFVSKRCVPQIMLEAVRSVARGDIFLEQSVAQQLALDGIGGENNPVKRLTDREFEVFRLLAEGKAINDVAKTLFLSPKTVSTYQTHIFNKLGVSNVAALTRLAIRQGFIDA